MSSKITSYNGLRETDILFNRVGKKMYALTVALNHAGFARSATTSFLFLGQLHCLSLSFSKDFDYRIADNFTLNRLYKVVPQVL